MFRPALAPLARGLVRLSLAAVVLCPALAAAQSQDDPYGDCCVAKVSMTAFDTWQVTCGSCATNPGRYTISQPDPEKLEFVGPGGVAAQSRYDAAAAICTCPSQKARRDREASMRRFDGK